jgi:hypothetical protein
MSDVLFLKNKMDRSYLLQFLEAPSKFDNPWGSFGGGYKNGGLSDDAMKLIKDIWEFHYMGAAEFEFGAVPTALHFLANQIPQEKKKKGLFAKRPEPRGGLVTGKVILDGTSKAEGFREVKGKSVWYICPTSYEAEVKERITRWAISDHIRGEYTKCGIGLHRALVGDPKYPVTTKGWLEIDNGFMFFIDKEMFEKTKNMFGIE